MDIFSSYFGKAIEETHSWKHKNVPKSSYNCKIGEHDWDSYANKECQICGKRINDEPHYHHLCTSGQHEWVGCRCYRCGEIREEGHNWNKCFCKNVVQPPTIGLKEDVANVEFLLLIGPKFRQEPLS